MSDLTVRDVPETHRSLHPSRVAIWPVETGGYGIDFTYHGATDWALAAAQAP
jgi:hypothetical protein